MSDNHTSKTLHEIQNRICFISSSLQLIEKQHPEVSEFDFWSSTMEELIDLSLYVNSSKSSL